ncbi:hypothetical protein SAMN04488019_104169 [Phaeobacter italicus]|nr:hypothetical protein SAMN04488019_104169 [Phaeobacter italicus]
MGEFRPVPAGTNSPGDCLRRGRAEPFASNRASQRAALAGCPLGREASAARPAPDLRCGSSRWLVKGRLASNRANQRAALAGCPLGREASAARPAPDLRCGSSRWLVKGRLASNRANQRAALAGCPLGREASAARPAPDLPPGKAHSRPPKVRRGPCVVTLAGWSIASSWNPMNAVHFPRRAQRELARPEGAIWPCNHFLQMFRQPHDYFRS